MKTLSTGPTSNFPKEESILIAPMALLTGLRETFTSTTWTLTYLELRTLDSLDPIPENIVTNDLDENSIDIEGIPPSV